MCPIPVFSRPAVLRWAMALTVLFVFPIAADRLGDPVHAQSSTRTVFDGVYTEEQAERGRERYRIFCAACHDAGADGSHSGLLRGDFDGEYGDVGRFFHFVQASMPEGQGGTLNTSTYVDIVAYILSLNRYPAGPEELTTESMVGVEIIAEDGPELLGGSLARVVGCLAPKQDGEWLLTSATAPERPDDAQGDDAARPLGDRDFPLMFVITPLDAFVGHRLSVSGLLLGDGGVNGINVTRVHSVADSCP